MAKQYRIPPGTVYPATVAGYRKAKAGKLDEVDWTKPNEEELVLQAPYPEIVSSWLKNGIVEAGETPVEKSTRKSAVEPVETPVEFVEPNIMDDNEAVLGEEVND
jgi:hypothetical protein